MNRKSRIVSLLLALAMAFSTIVSPISVNVFAAEGTVVRPIANYKYSTGIDTNVSNGSGYVDATEHVNDFNNVDAASVNVTAATSRSGVQSLFFIGDSSQTHKYLSFYVDGHTLGVEGVSGSKYCDVKVSLDSNIDLTKKHKYSFVYDGGTSVTLYFDGEQVYTKSEDNKFSKDLLTSANYMGFGKGIRSNGYNGYPFTGTITNCEIFNRALSAEEVMAYAIADREDLVYQKRNVYMNGTSMVTDTNATNIEAIKSLNPMTVSIRYRLSDTSVNENLPLFTVSNNTTDNKYYSIWINPSTGTVGYNYNGNNKPMGDGTARNYIDNEWHTLVYRVAPNGNALKGSYIFIDGNWINQYTTYSNDFTGFSCVSGLNSINFGCLDLATSTNDKVFKGAIDSIRIFSTAFSNDDIIEECNKIAYESTQVVSAGERVDYGTLFSPGYDGSAAYRIPSLITTENGTVIAGIDQRHNGSHDAGDIDMVVRRRERGQVNFDDTIKVVNLINLGSGGQLPMCIDMSMVEDRVNDKIYMFYGMFPQSSGLMDTRYIQNGSGYKEINGKKYQVVYTGEYSLDQTFDNGRLFRQHEFGTIREGGIVYDINGNKTDYTVITECEAPYYELGNVYENGEYVGNMYLYDHYSFNRDDAGVYSNQRVSENTDKAPFSVLRSHHLWVSVSEDDGKTWARPKDITPQIKEEWMQFIGTGPGQGIQLKDGTLVVPIYTAGLPNGSINNQASAVIISEDYGKTWQLGESPVELYTNIHREDNFTSDKQLTEAQVVQFNNGQIGMFMRNQSGKVRMAISDDKGMTWKSLNQIEVPEVYCQLSAIHYTKGNEEFVAISKPTSSGRNNGHIYLGQVSYDENNNASIAWNWRQQMNKQKYQYSCLSILQPITTEITPDTNAGQRDVVATGVDNVKFGVHYEDDTNNGMHLYYSEVDEAWIKAPLADSIQGAPKLVSSSVTNDGDIYTITLTFDQKMMVTGDAALVVSSSRGTRVNANYVSGSATEKIKFRVTLPDNVKQGVVSVTGISVNNGTLENTIGQQPESVKVAINDFTALRALDASATTQHSDSREEGVEGGAANVIDGNPKTFWHSTYGNVSIKLPQSITIDLGATKNIYKLGYLPRQGNISGHIRNYQVEISTDNSAFTKVSEGTFINGYDWQYVEFAPVDARYVKLTAITSTASDSCSMAELKAYQYEEGVIVKGDNTSLTRAIEMASKLNEADYTSASYSKVSEAFEKANRIKDAEVSQNILDNADMALRQAIKALVKTSTLLTIISEADAFISRATAADYTTESWSAFTQVLATAKLYNEDTTQKGVTDRIMALKNAKDSLALQGVDTTTTAKMYGYTLSLDGTIGVNYYVDMSNVLDVEKDQYKMKFTVNGKTTYIDYNPNERKEFNGKYYYRFTYYVAAKQMRDTIIGQIMKGDSAVSKEYKYSVKEYCNNTLKRSIASEKLKTLLKTMLTFGGWSQQQFKYNINALANDGINDVYLDTVTLNDLKGYNVINNSVLGLELAFTLALESDTEIRMYIIGDVTDYEFAVDNKVKTLTPCKIANSDGTKSDGYCLNISNVAAQHLDKMFEITITDNQSNVYKLRYSALTYAYNKLKQENKNDADVLLDNLMKAMYLYNQGANIYFNKTQEEIKLEMKDIQNITLFKQDGVNVDKLSSVDIADLSNINNYLVKVDMEKLPSFYAPIRSYSIENDMLKFVLDYNNIVQYNKAGVGNNYLEVEYGPVENNVAQRHTLDSLLEQIRNNPSGTYTLNHDLDFSTITATTPVLDINFTGTLNGNGHKIENISGPLFRELNGATIENLVIQNGTMRAYGVIAPTMTSATIRNVHLNNITLNAPDDKGTGSFAGTTQSNTLIENCSATNVTVGSNKRIGGLVGKLNGSILRNCYLSGSVSSNSDACGGLVGEAFSGSTIENCYANVRTNFNSSGGSRGGIIGNPVNTIMNNNLSLATSSSGDGKGSRIFGKYQYNIATSSTNNYELATSNLTSNASHSAVNTIEEATLRTKAFYIETLGWDETIWCFDNVEAGGYPVLRNADPNYNIKERPSNNSLYIPEYSRIKQLENYDATKEIAYHNLNKLMPFFDAKYLVEYGSRISSDNVLNTKLIQGIVPLNSENEVIVSLTDTTVQNIAKIKVIFEDESIQEYALTYDKTIEMIANYEMVDLGIAYNYPKYILKEDSALIATLTQQIEGYTFADHLNDITSEDEDKRFKENFDQNVKTNARELVINLLANVPEYNISIDSSILENIVKQELEANNQLKKLLVAYNYFDRMYKINIGGAIVRDAIFFDGGMFDENLNPIQTTNQFLACTTRATNQSVNYYNTCLKPLTKKASIGDFLDFFIKNFAGYEDVTRWFPENYQGFVVEAPAKDFSTRVEYRAWNLMKKRPEIILATLTMPSDQMYVLSIPSQLIVGSIHIYKEDVDNPAVRAEFQGWLETYGELLGEYYNTTLKFVPNGENLLPRKMMMHYDKRAIVGGVYQDPNTTEDPFVKHFYGMIKKQSQLNGSAAYANGTDVYWVANTVFFNDGRGGNTGTFTHESAHNHDGYFYLLGNGRRPGAGAECFTDSVICQRMNIETPHFNAMYNYDFTAEIAQNLTQERIDSTQKLEDFYQKMWEAVNAIDYIEAQAFLQCSPEVQSKIGKKYVYGSDDPNASQGAIALTAEDFRTMDLQSIQDLWNNQICIRVGATLNGDSLDNVYWYLPHNDAGVPEAKCFKRNAFEMLSVGGYAGGFVPYMSGASQNDLDAIRKITKDETMTWEKYQMNKYATVSQNINNSAYFNADEMVQMFKEAMEADAQGNNIINARMLRRYLYCYLQRATNDFRSGIYDEKQAVHITDGTQFVEQIKQDPYALYVLDNDIDLSGMSGTSSITDVNFVGELDGNGHTISGIGQPIFNMIKFSNVHDLKLDNISILGTAGGHQTGALARTTSYSNFKNVHIVDGTIEGGNYVGGFAGKAINSFISECSVNVVIRATGNNVAGIVGQTDSTSVINSYSLGQVKGNQRSGGLVGEAKNSYLGNCYSNSTVESTSGNSGGFVGRVFEDSRVINNVSFGSVKNAYKFDGMSAIAMFGTNYQNNYEYEEPIGTSTLNRTGIDFSGKITSVRSATIQQQSFYTDSLHWDENIWDFTNVAQGGLPKLKNLDSNNVTSTIEIINIASVDDFLRIQDKLDGIYNITADLDFSQIASSDIKSGIADKISGSCIIPGTFTGKICGNGHTLSNLENATLFNVFSGSVSDLNIIDFNNILPRQDTVAAFARNTNNATLTNIKFKNITLSGTNRVAVVTGMDGRTGNSTFKQISVENANVTGSGVYVSAFIGRKYGGSVTDCFVQGNVSFGGAAGGGVFGATQGNERITNVVSKVNINRTKNTSGYNSNGGMIGELNNNPTIINSITLGNIAHTDGSEANIGKFISYSDKIARLTNCFEYLDATGVSYVSDTTTGQLDAASDEMIHSVEFYHDTLQLDSNIWNFTTVATNGYPTLK